MKTKTRTAKPWCLLHSTTLHETRRMIHAAAKSALPWRSAMDHLTDRYAAKISGIFECYDGITLQGTLPWFCHGDGMTGCLYAHDIRQIHL